MANICIGVKENVYICTVFFMVLDLRLTMEIGCRDDNLFLFYSYPVFSNPIFCPCFAPEFKSFSSGITFYRIFAHEEFFE